MPTSLQIARITPLSSSFSDQCLRSLPVRTNFRVACCAAQVQELRSEIKPWPDSATNDTSSASVQQQSGNRKNGNGIHVPRQRYISVSKMDLVDAIVSSMFPSEDEAAQFVNLSKCLDSILHAEHKSILEEMRDDFDLAFSTKNNKVCSEEFPENRNETDTAFNKSTSIDREAEYQMDLDMEIPSEFTFNLGAFLGSMGNSKRNSLKDSRFAIPARFQRNFMRLLYNAEFEELSPRDLMLTSALNTDYLLTLPIYIDWKKASESSSIIFRRGYATERERGLLIVEKLDYLQSKLLQKIFFLVAKPLGRFGIWLNEILKSITQKQDTDTFIDKIKLWIKESNISQQSYLSKEQVSGELSEVDLLLKGSIPIWMAAERAATRYEGILSAVGPRERLFRKFLTWVGVVPSTPEEALDRGPDSSGYQPHLRSIFLSRISLSDIWKPASATNSENDFWKMLRTAFSILFSESILQEPAFQELVLLYIEDDAKAPSLQLKIYEKIPFPDLPVIFPHKKLSFRILDTVRLDVATILGLLAYFINYKFENILSSPSALLLDVVATSALVLYVTRVLLGYKQTRDRYQLLVNKTLNEKTVASGFGSFHFLLDASEQQQYKEAILAYAILLKAENGQEVTCTKSIGDRCEKFLHNVFQEQLDAGGNAG